MQVNSHMSTIEHLNTIIPTEMAGLRIDKALALLFPDYSRARLQQWIRDEHVLINAKKVRAKDKIQGGEQVDITAEIEETVTWQAQPIPLNIIYEDDDIIIVDKPVGLVVHPGAGNQDKTLVNALLHHAPELEQLPRAGIIHRIDKDTSGLLVVTRSIKAHTFLSAKLQAHEFLREYQAITQGVLVAGGNVDAPIGRHPTQRTKMAVIHNGKPAITHYRVLERYRAHTHIRVQLETGRTHQIRVHMAHQHYPLVGDPVYGGRLRLPAESSELLKNTLRHFPRQALHAAKLGFIHPSRQEMMEWESPLPQDMLDLLNVLAQDKQDHA